MEGEISKSMGIDTKPAFKFEINGFWLMLDPNADEATVEHVTNFCITCRTCKHKDLDPFDHPCDSCIKLNELGTNNWEAKQ
jgi:hypothetical protein